MNCEITNLNVATDDCCPHCGGWQGCYMLVEMKGKVKHKYNWKLEDKYFPTKNVADKYSQIKPVKIYKIVRCLDCDKKVGETN